MQDWFQAGMLTAAEQQELAQVWFQAGMLTAAEQQELAQTAIAHSAWKSLTEVLLG